MCYKISTVILYIQYVLHMKRIKTIKAEQSLISISACKSVTLADVYTGKQGGGVKGCCDVEGGLLVGRGGARLHAKPG